MMILLLAALLADCPSTDPTGAVPPAASSYTVGKAEPGWCLTGVDLSAAAGPDAATPVQIIAFQDDGTRTADRLQRGAFVAPANWRRMGGFAGSAPPNGDFFDVLFQFRGKRVIAVSTNSAWRVGNAICVTESGPVSIYLVGGAAPDAVDSAAIGQELNGHPRAGKPATICFNAIPLAHGGYRFHFHAVTGGVATEVNDFYRSVRIVLAPIGDIERYRPSPADGGNPDLHRM